MAAELSERVQELAEARDVPESEVFERALERGVEELWAELVLSQYLDGELDREDAIERVGRAKVKRAEREWEFVKEDIEWGLNA
jgi:predicted transcriptional regulator